MTSIAIRCANILILLLALTAAGRADIDYLDLIQAARRGDSEAIKACLIDTSIQGQKVLLESGQNLLTLAARSGSLPTLELLVNAGLDINAVDKNGNGPLHEAARKGNVGMIAFLLSKKIDCFRVNQFYLTSVRKAINSGHPECATLILKSLKREGKSALYLKWEEICLDVTEANFAEPDDFSTRSKVDQLAKIRLLLDEI